ncbi:MAG: ComF family protein [Anaerolineales bacterium]|nr:ComF family protein [Anaerolineales bacterium]
MTGQLLAFRCTVEKWLFVFQDLFFPPGCFGCGKIGTHWCEECQYKTTLLNGPACEICGVPQERHQICSNCQKNPPAFDQVRTFAKYENPFRKGIVRLKYHGNAALGEVLSVYLIQMLLSLQWKFDMVLPVPLSVSRRKKRGYNQTALLAYPISTYFRLPYRPYALQRIRDTRSQVGLTGEERRENLKEAFIAIPNLVQQKNVIIIDDVFTTGSTLNTCAQALKSAGASKVYGVTLGRPLLYDQELWDLI